MNEKANAPAIDEAGVFHFRAVSSDARDAITLDLSARLVRWFQRFEFSCSLDCCGISALRFDLPTQWDRRWNYHSDTMKELNALRAQVENAHSAAVLVRHFQKAIYREDLLFLLDYLCDGMKQSIEWK